VLGTPVGSIICELEFHTSVPEKSQRVVMTGPSRGLCRHYSALCTEIVRIRIMHFTSFGSVSGPKVTTSLSQNG